MGYQFKVGVEHESTFSSICKFSSELPLWSCCPGRNILEKPAYILFVTKFSGLWPNLIFNNLATLSL
jgi:hypothetical protein